MVERNFTGFGIDSWNEYKMSSTEDSSFWCFTVLLLEMLHKTITPLREMSGSFKEFQLNPSTVRSPYKVFIEDAPRTITEMPAE